MIDLKFCYDYEVGKTDVLHAVLDGISYDIFCMEEEDYVMKIMATYYGGSNCPPIIRLMNQIFLSPLKINRAPALGDVNFR